MGIIQEKRGAGTALGGPAGSLCHAARTDSPPLCQEAGIFLSCCGIRQTPGGLLLPSVPSTPVVFQRLGEDPGEAPLHHLPLHLPQPGPLLRALAGRQPEPVEGHVLLNSRWVPQRPCQSSWSFLLVRRCLQNCALLTVLALRGAELQPLWHPAGRGRHLRFLWQHLGGAVHPLDAARCLLPLRSQPQHPEREGGGQCAQREAC